MAAALPGRVAAVAASSRLGSAPAAVAAVAAAVAVVLAAVAALVLLVAGTMIVWNCSRRGRRMRKVQRSSSKAPWQVVLLVLRRVPSSWCLHTTSELGCSFWLVLAIQRARASLMLCACALPDNCTGGLACWCQLVELLRHML